MESIDKLTAFNGKIHKMYSFSNTKDIGLQTISRDNFTLVKLILKKNGSKVNVNINTSAIFER